MKGRRVILVVADDAASIALDSYEPPAVMGLQPTRLAAGVFGYKTGATLQVWPPDRTVATVPVKDKDIHVVLDPHTIPTSVASETASIDYRVKLCTLKGVADVRASVALGSFTLASKLTVSDSSCAHATLPYACGIVAGHLLQSAAARWFIKATPETVKLRDAIGRSATMESVMPVAELTAMGGKKFRLNPASRDEILFSEVRG